MSPFADCQKIYASKNASINPSLVAKIASTTNVLSVSLHSGGQVQS